MARIPDSPPAPPSWPRGHSLVGARLLTNLYRLLRPRRMGSDRQVHNPSDGGLRKEEIDLSLRVEASVLEAFAYTLDRAIRADSALWAGYDGASGLSDDLDAPRIFSWPGWASLTISAQI